MGCPSPRRVFPPPLPGPLYVKFIWNFYEGLFCNPSFFKGNQVVLLRYHFLGAVNLIKSNFREVMAGQ